jgi:hypothetical protein
MGKSTYIWPLFYQTVAGAAIVPLAFAFFTSTSAKPNYYSPYTRSVPLSRANTLLYALLLGYLVPTILMFLPVSLSTCQLFIALWQPCPLLINLFSFLFSRFHHDPPAAPGTEKRQPKEKREADITPLTTIYLLSALIAALPHWFIIYKHFTSPSPQHSLSYIFLPSTTRTIDGLTPILQFVFQIDWWVIFVAGMVWCVQVVYDMYLLGEEVNLWGGVVNLILGCVVVGPGAVMGVVWWWREGVMAELAMMDEVDEKNE